MLFMWDLYMTYILSYIFLYYYLHIPHKRNNSSHIYGVFYAWRVASQAFPFLLPQLRGLYLWWRDHGCSWIWLEESLRRAEKGLSGSCSRGPARAERQDRDAGAGGPKMSVALLKVSDALRICWICILYRDECVFCSIPVLNLKWNREMF